MKGGIEVANFAAKHGVQVHFELSKRSEAWLRTGDQQKFFIGMEHRDYEWATPSTPEPSIFSATWTHCMRPQDISRYGVESRLNLSNYIFKLYFGTFWAIVPPTLGHPTNWEHNRFFSQMSSTF